MVRLRVLLELPAFKQFCCRLSYAFAEHIFCDILFRLLFCTRIPCLRTFAGALARRVLLASVATLHDFVQVVRRDGEALLLELLVRPLHAQIGQVVAQKIGLTRFIGLIELLLFVTLLDDFGKLLEKVLNLQQLRRHAH